VTDPVLAVAALAPICLALPETEQDAYGPHRWWTVRAKTFARFNDDHHGDGMTLLITKAEPGLAETLVGPTPSPSSAPPTWATRAGSACAWTSARSIETRSAASSSTAPS